MGKKRWRKEPRAKSLGRIKNPWDALSVFKFTTADLYSNEVSGIKDGKMKKNFRRKPLQYTSYGGIRKIKGCSIVL